MADFSQLIADVQAVIRENGRQLITGPVLQSSLIEIINTINADKQDTISDLDAIRAGALLGATAYQLPPSGIPASDLAAGVQSAIWNASAHGEWAGQVAMFDDEGYFDGSGIDASEVATHAEVDAKYTKPAGGIPFEDLEHSVQVSLEKADNSIQPNMDYDGQIPVYNEDGYIEGSGITPDDLLQKDGTYPDLTAGAVLGAPVPAEFAFRGAPYGGSAVVDTVLGNSVKWNQLIDAADFPSESQNGITFTNNNDGTVSASGTASGYARTAHTYDTISGHIYVIKGSPSAPNQEYGISVSSPSVYDYGSGVIFTANSASTGINIFVQNGTVISGTIKYRPQLHDLSAIFGSGNEPSTVSAFEAWMAQHGFAGLTDFNPGQVLGNAAKNLKTAGFNLWDEEWYAQGGSVRPTNRIPILPNTEYCFRGVKGSYPDVYFDDASGVQIPGTTIYLTGVSNNGFATFTPPAGARFVRFAMSSTYGTTYNHDICISISGPRNGQYEPYVGAIDTIALNLSTLTGIPEGGGSSEVVFPLGLQSIGGVSDWGKGSQALRQFKVVDLGDLTWTYVSGGAYFRTQISTLKVPGISNDIRILCDQYVSTAPQYSGGMPVADNKTICQSKDSSGTTTNLFVKDTGYSSADTFTAAVTGIKLVYELATPVKFTLDHPLPALYETADGGPEYIEGPAGTAPTTAPFAGEIRYSQPQADANGLAVAILDALKAASKISSYTFGIDPETSKPAITIS